MKHFNLSNIIVTFSFLIIIFSSCSNNDDDEQHLEPSSSSVKFEGEGGHVDISLNSAEWYISDVINRNGNINIWGDVLSPDGDIIKSNEKLDLKEMGMLKAAWDNKGFLISRTSTNALAITVNENSTGSDFNFAIVLRSGSEMKEIEVMQKKSEGYKFEKIEFYLEKNDGDSIYNKAGISYVVNVTEPNEYMFFPFKGIDSDVQSYFKSSDKNAFVWIEDYSLKVEVPYYILSDGKVIMGGERRFYGAAVIKQPYSEVDLVDLVSVVSGENNIDTEIEFRKRTISYKLTLTNNRTGDKKEVLGKWIEISPTGKYSIKRRS